MIETTNERTSFEQDAIDSRNQVNQIIKSVDYSFDKDLKDIDNPKVLVLGIGPLFPEAILLNEYSKESNKKVDITCVDEKMPVKEYPELLFNLRNSDIFNMELVESTFESLPPEENEYDLVLLLRSKNLSLINSEVLKNISKSIKPNGTLIISGGNKDEITINNLQENGLNIEIRKEIPEYIKDYWGSYAGKNTVAKFKKA